MNITTDMIIRHCANCDSTLAGNHFQEWLPILQAGTKVKLQDDKSYLDVEYVQKGLNCRTCIKNEVEQTVVMVVFKWQKGE